MAAEKSDKNQGVDNLKHIEVSCGGFAGIDGVSIDELTRALILTGIPVMAIEPVLPFTEAAAAESGYGAGHMKLDVSLAISEGDWLATGGKDAYLERVEKALGRLRKYCGDAPVMVGPLRHDLPDDQVAVNTATEPYSLFFRSKHWDLLSKLGFGTAWKKSQPQADDRVEYYSDPGVGSYVARYSEEVAKPKLTELSGSVELPLVPLSLALLEIEPEKIREHEKVMLGVQRVQRLVKKYVPNCQIGTGRRSSGAKMLYITIPKSEKAEAGEQERLMKEAAQFLQRELCGELEIPPERCEIKKTKVGTAILVDIQALQAIGTNATFDLKIFNPASSEVKPVPEVKNVAPKKRDARFDVHIHHVMDNAVESESQPDFALGPVPPDERQVLPMKDTASHVERAIIRESQAAVRGKAG